MMENQGFLIVYSVTAAIIGLYVVLVTGVVTWKECLSEAVTWDTLTSFAALIAMAGYLNKYGLISSFSQTVVKFVGGLGLSWQLSFGILVLLYFYSHDFFPSGAAHIGAKFTAFLSVASTLGTPPYFGRNGPRIPVQPHGWSYPLWYGISTCFLRS